jgi:hypothetical protein
MGIESLAITFVHYWGTYYLVGSSKKKKKKKKVLSGGFNAFWSAT